VTSKFFQKVREMFSVVRYLAERVDLPHLLKIGGDSAFELCESWAKSRGFISARSAGRVDANR